MAAAGMGWAIIGFWRHYLRWSRLDKRTEPRKLYADVLPLRGADMIRLVASKPAARSQQENERASALHYLRKLFRFSLAAAILFTIPFFVTPWR